MADCSLNAPNPQEEAATERLSHFLKVTLLAKVGLEFLTTPQYCPASCLTFLICGMGTLTDLHTVVL